MTNNEKMIEVFKGSRAKLEEAHNLNETITSKGSEYYSSTKKLGENYSEEILKKLIDNKAKLEEANNLNETITSSKSEYLEAVKFVSEKSNEINSLSLNSEIACQSSPGFATCNSANVAIRASNIAKQSQKDKLTAEKAKIELVDESTVKMNEILKGFSSEFTNNKTVAEMISEYETKINQLQEMQKIETANAEALKKAIDDSTVDMNSILNEFTDQFIRGTTIAEMISFYEGEITELEQQIKADLDENAEIGSDSYLVDQDGHRVEEDYTYSN